MRNDNIRKYILPNIPYLFFAWAFLKLGTAFRLAVGGNAALKLINMAQTVGPAFADLAPGLYATDWIIGITGAVLLRWLIYNKSKKAKNSGGMWSTAAPAGVRKKTSSRL